MTNDGRPLATTLIDSGQVKKLTNSGTTAEACYAGEPNNYRASVYFNSATTLAYLKSASAYDTAVLYGIN